MWLKYLIRLIFLATAFLSTLFLMNGCGGGDDGYNLKRYRGENILPIALDDTAYTELNQSIMVQVLANDSDRNRDTLTITDLSAVSGGTASLVMGGNIVEITPNLGSTAPVSFDYTISDGFGGTSTATVTVFVSGCVAGPPSSEANFVEAAINIELVPINAGCFLMGSPESEVDRNIEEGPVHQVTLTRNFYIGKYEVTQGQWEAVMGGAGSWPGTSLEAPSLEYGLSATHPAYFVSWNDITKEGGFLDALNLMVNCDTSNFSKDETRYHPSTVPAGCYRLPTESEWEYSARGGTTGRFSYGDDQGYLLLDSHAWYAANSHANGNLDPNYGTHPVGQKISNPYGLFDVSGNVSEWTYDYFDSYSVSSKTDPVGPSSGSRRFFRGGSWYNTAQYLRSAHREFAGLPQIRSSGTGFRVLKVR